MNTDEDTIFALSTPLGTSAIAVIRISGSKSIELISKIFGINKEKIKNNLASVGWIYDPETGQRIDNAIYIYFQSPRTFTGEDMAEIHCHGGLIIIRKVMSILVLLGARPAENGEFSKRAFLNGKMDLVQAEAIMEAISSKSLHGVLSAASRLDGSTSSKIKSISDSLKELLTIIEASIDFPEDIDEPHNSNIIKSLNDICESLKKIIINSKKSIKESNGYKIVIIGKPNVGKSSLLNALLKHERAIVTNIPGTTTDIIESTIYIKGVPFTFVDTAGIREPSNIIEEMGISKAVSEIDKSDIILAVFDISRQFENDDKIVIDAIADKKVKKIAILNKIDLDSKLDFDNYSHFFENIIKISVKDGIGIEYIEDLLLELVSFGGNELPNYEDILLGNDRQIALCENCLGRLYNAIASAKDDLPIDVLSIDIREAICILDNISGISLSDEIVEGIFSKFCVGK